MVSSSISLSDFKNNLEKEVAQCAENHRVLRVQRQIDEDFVVISASDWAAIEETLYLNQIPGMVESIQEARKEPLEKGTPLKELDW